jgi:hypothetical protein
VTLPKVPLEPLSMQYGKRKPRRSPVTAWSTAQLDRVRAVERLGAIEDQ